MQELKSKIIKAVEDVKATKPLAGSITNDITINFVANAQLSCGGSAAMFYLADEGEAIVTMGGAAYLNMGALLPVHKESMPVVAKACFEQGKTCVVDPVALGIGALRSEIMSELKAYKPAIIRGNASEIITLASFWNLSEEKSGNAKGVDTTETVDEAEKAAILVARFTGGAVAVSGETDLVTDGKTVVRLSGGSPLMEKVTGCGCSLGGVMATYACVTDPFTAALAASALYNLAGARAHEKVEGPGAFYSRFLDEIYLATAQEIAEAVVSGVFSEAKA